MQTYFVLLTLFFFTFILLILSHNRLKIGHTKKVILLGVDGLGSHNLERANDVTNFNFLLNHGMWTLDTKIDPQYDGSGPNWVGILSGRNSYSSGIHDNRCEMPKHDVIMNQLEKEGKSVAVSSQWDIVACYCNNISLYLYEPRLKTNMSRLMNTIKSNYSFIFIHVDNMDYYGHRNGGGSDRYNEEVNFVDKDILKPILDYVKETPNTTLLLTADHGHELTSTSHSSTKYPVPFLAYGTGITPGKINGIRNTEIYHIIKRLLL